MESLPTPPFKGFRSPNTTPIPDEVFDELLADLSGAELKVLLYICRRTFGWKKESDNISMSQLTGGIKKKNGQPLDRGTGLAKDSVARVVKSLEQKGIILRHRRTSLTKGYEATTYTLNIIPLSENRTSLGDKIGQGLVRKSDIQETVLQETKYKTVGNGDENIFAQLPDLQQPPEHTAYVVEELLKTLGDKHSARFYALVARKVPEATIREALAELKADGAQHPAKLFTYKMKRYALERLTQRI